MPEAPHEVRPNAGAKLHGGQGAGPLHGTISTEGEPTKQAAREPWDLAPIELTLREGMVTLQSVHSQ
jgi:hypothetical protein